MEDSPAQGDQPPLRIGVLTDMSGTTANVVGRGSVVAAQLAADDNCGAVLGRKIELEATGGTFVTMAFYWDMDDATRAFAGRFPERMGRPPTMLQAGAYSAVNHRLEAMKAAGTTDATAVATKMRELPVEEFVTHGGRIRPDGRVVRDMYLAQVKNPAESRGEWDLYKILRSLPGESLLPPVGETGCPTTAR